MTGSVDNDLKKLIINKYGSVNKFANSIGLPQSTIATVLSRGIENSNVKTVYKICNALGVSVDKLMSRIV